MTAIPPTPPVFPKLTPVIFTRKERPDLFEQAFKIRLDVFVVEQEVPPETEQDEKDDVAIHWLIYAEGETTPVATGRLVPYGPDHQQAKIGRMAVSKAGRGQNIGRFMLRCIMDYARDHGFREAVMEAQCHAIGFYEKEGFVAFGDEFLYDGIPHRWMRKAL